MKGLPFLADHSVVKGLGCLVKDKLFHSKTVDGAQRSNCEKAKEISNISKKTGTMSLSIEI